MAWKAVMGRLALGGANVNVPDNNMIQMINIT